MKCQLSRLYDSCGLPEVDDRSVTDEAYLEVAGTERAEANAIIDPHTSLFYTDEEGIAKALVDQYGINMDRVHVVFQELDVNYNGDVDDLAFLYFQRVKQRGGLLLQALRIHAPLRNLLIRVLDEGWTTDAEYRTMSELRRLGKTQ